MCKWIPSSVQPRKQCGGWVGRILTILAGTRYYLVRISKARMFTVDDLVKRYISLDSTRMPRSEV